MTLHLLKSAAIVLLLVQNTNAQQSSLTQNIIIEGEINSGFTENMAVLQLYSLEGVRSNNEIQHVPLKGEIINNKVKWIINTNRRTNIRSAYIGFPKYYGIPMLPGDSIHLKRENNELKFTGKGATAWEMIYSMEKISDSMDMAPDRRKLSSRYYPVFSVDDYLQWNVFLDKRFNILLKVMQKYKSKIPSAIYDEIYYLLCDYTEYYRLLKFQMLRSSKTPGHLNQYGLSNEDLCRIYDSTMTTKPSHYLRFESEESIDMYYQWSMMKLDFYRSNGKFFPTTEKETFRDNAQIIRTVYDLSKKRFTGLIREKMLAFTFWHKVGLLAEIGFTPQTDSLLNDYYSQPGYPEYKAIVKAAEVKYRERAGRTYLPSFSLTDMQKQEVNNKDLAGKIVVFEFWFTGCHGCISMSPALQKVESHFKNDSNVVFARVSIDKNYDKWLKSIQEEQYTTSDGLHMYTGGQGKAHPFIQSMVIGSYPSLLISNASGQLVPFNYYKTDPRIDSGKGLIKLITQELAYEKDGPYVFRKGDSILSYKIEGTILKQSILPRTNAILSATTHNNNSFDLEIHSSFPIHPDEYKRPENLLILSDIEGNFDAFSELLINNQVIDRNFNWTFGEGHLVFAGDMFDRGKQVTECLWLVYMLEKKAEKSGGMVHFVLGNHEIMNLQGDHKYTHPKYKQNAELIGMSYKSLYGPESELGQWLRNKNIIEKIGDLLILHGGISSAIVNSDLNIEQINAASRPFFDRNEKLTKEAAAILGYAGPLWYRGYYDKDGVPSLIDSVLQKFDVKRIITGHTLIADTISVLYNGKLFNTDTRHAKELSEALLINGRNYYRVNREGKRVLLYSEQE